MYVFTSWKERLTRIYSTEITDVKRVVVVVVVVVEVVDEFDC